LALDVWVDTIDTAKRGLDGVSIHSGPLLLHKMKEPTYQEPVSTNHNTTAIKWSLTAGVQMFTGGLTPNQLNKIMINASCLKRQWTEGSAIINRRRIESKHRELQRNATEATVDV